MSISADLETVSIELGKYRDELSRLQSGIRDSREECEIEKDELDLLYQLERARTLIYAAESVLNEAAKLEVADRC